jgi:hypothetical protein
LRRRTSFFVWVLVGFRVVESKGLGPFGGKFGGGSRQAGDFLLVDAERRRRLWRGFLAIPEVGDILLPRKLSNSCLGEELFQFSGSASSVLAI